jgi:ferric-dicitrate binding protein FerR (iron transport regulator)
VPVDVAPASDKAVLTLSNGQQVQLNNGASETIKDGALPIENKNGRLVYNGGEAGIQGQTGNAADVAVNTMTTPNGGLYKLTLADGTKVWLNAASSITYPVAFAGANRKVSITGEVYFEVAKDEKRPFIVDVNKKSTVEVLGTSFNINSYTNEEAVKTTLLEGSVKVIKAGQSALLTHGQQAIVANSGRKPGITVRSDANIEQAMAWRYGLFTFKDADLPSVTRQLERWYDIKVVYLGKVPEIILKGKMYRNVNLSDVLEFLKTSGVATRMEGKTLIVL